MLVKNLWRSGLVAHICQYDSPTKLVNPDARLKGEAYTFYKLADLVALTQRFSPVRIQAVQSMDITMQGERESIDITLRMLFHKLIPSGVALKWSHLATSWDSWWGIRAPGWGRVCLWGTITRSIWLKSFRLRIGIERVLAQRSQLWGGRWWCGGNSYYAYSFLEGSGNIVELGLVFRWQR